MSTYMHARALVQRAREKHSLTHAVIAEMCAVNIGSVKRWVNTGKADKKTIQPLLDLVGPGYRKPEDVARTLQEMYEDCEKPNEYGNRVKRYCLTRRQFAQVVGLEDVWPALVRKIREAMIPLNLGLVECADGYQIHSLRWMSRTHATMEDEQIAKFFGEMAERDDELEGLEEDFEL